MNFIKNVIGLTGLYCSGKSTVEKYLEKKYGFFIIDVDRLGHVSLNEKKEKLIAMFGEMIVSSDGKIDRKILGNIVFSDKNKLAMLNSVVHPFIVQKTVEMMETSEKENICINAALLFEMGLYKYCKKIVVVKSPVLSIIKRGMKRDNNSILKILKILSSQKVLSLAKKNRESAEIFYINNDSNPEKLEKLTDEIM